MSTAPKPAHLTKKLNAVMVNGKKKGLTAKQAAFINALNPGVSYTEAALKAGYSPKHISATAYSLMQVPHIIAAVEEKQKKAAKKFELTAEKVIADIIKVQDNCMQLSSNGKMMSPMNALKALELLGRSLGLYIDKSQIEAAITTVRVIREDD